MRSFYFILLFFLVISCQESKISEIDSYKASKVADSQELETRFNKQITENIDAQKNASISLANFIVASKTVDNLKETLATVEDSADNFLINKKSKSNNKKSSETDTLDNFKPDVNTNTEPAPNHQKIDNGALLLNVRNYDETHKKVAEIASKYQANITNEKEYTTDFHKSNFMEIQVSPENFNTLMTEFKNLAVIIRQKYIWQQAENENFLKFQSQMTSTQNNIIRLESQLASLNNVEDKLRIQQELAKANEVLDLLVLTTKTTINNKAYCSISLSFFQHIELAKPAPESFKADFSSNLIVGWDNFKFFLLSAALVWPYILLGILFAATAALAIRNHRKKERQFRLQLLHAQNVPPKP